MIGGLTLAGKDLSIVDTSQSLKIASFDIADLQSATLKNLVYKNTNPGQATEVSIPLVSFIPDIQSGIGGEIRTRDMRINKPVARVDLLQTTAPLPLDRLNLPVARIDKLVIEQPDLQFSNQGDKGKISLEWDGKKASTNEIVLIDLKTTSNSLSIRQLLFSLDHFLFTGMNGRKFDAGNGTLTALLDDLYLQQEPGMDLSWNATLSSLEGKDFIIDSLGRKAGRMVIG